MNIFDPVVSSSRAATTAASGNNWSGNCKATCKQKPWSRSRNGLSFTEGLFKENLPRTLPNLQSPSSQGGTPHPPPSLQNYLKTRSSRRPISRGKPPLPNPPSPVDTPDRGQIRRLAPARTLGPGPREEWATLRRPFPAAAPPLRDC